MVLEAINHLHAEKKPEEMIFFGFIITTVAIFLALWVFPSYASFAMVTFVVMAMLPLMIHIVKLEKEKQEKVKTWWQQITTHKKAISFFLFLLLGFTLAYTFWFLLLPVEVTNNLFFLQINTISEINNPTGAAVLQSSLGNIFVNNLRVLGLCFLFSFIFGSGAIFILVWNASVLGAAISTAVKIAIAAGGKGSASYLGAFSFAAIRFLIHGIPEFLAFFIGGLAGGIISFTILDYKLGRKKLFKKLPNLLKGALFLLMVSIGVLIAASLIEVYITPLFIP